ncbi:MAG: glycine--tRNA ligase subunit beta [Bacillota bacterium]
MTAADKLLMEIGCEEIPSRFIPRAMEQLEKEAASLLDENRLKSGSIETWATPRRLVILVNDLEMKQPDLVEKVKGPPVDRAYDDQGQPTKALQGFIKNHVITMEQIEEETIKNARYIVVEKEVAGVNTAELLPDLLPQLIQKLNFPRPMYWQSKDVRFARPIRWILALYDNKPVTFSYAGVESGNKTYGHRFLAPGPFEIDSVSNYFRCLENNYIVVDQERRREMILEQLEEKAEENSGKALVEEDLLEEVTYLVEYPVAVDGTFDSAFLDLPQEVPITSMQNHQRYFPVVEKNSGKLMPCFVGISNNRFHENIRKGYAKVLQARLADGRFFFNEDQKEPLENYVEKLNGVIFLEQLGSVDKKRERLIKLAETIGTKMNIPVEQIEKAKRTAHLCKADLVTNMVKEFPELQGVMGREYAALSGEEKEVAIAIYEHYQPRFAGDEIPTTIEGALVSLADRIDTLAGCFAIGIQPTGSQDPYALRRQAQGAVAILLGFKMEISLEEYINAALDTLENTLKLGSEQRIRVNNNLYDFLIQRIRFVLRDRGIGHDVTEAVLAVPFKNTYDLFKKASALEDYLKGPLLDDVIVAYNRVANLAQKADGYDIEKKLFEHPAEKELFSSLKTVEGALGKITNYDEALEHLQNLRMPVDHFFDNVMVMTEDQKLRENRLNLLAALQRNFNRVADFSKLQTP